MVAEGTEVTEHPVGHEGLSQFEGIEVVVLIGREVNDQKTRSRLWLGKTSRDSVSQIERDKLIDDGPGRGNHADQ